MESMKTHLVVWLSGLVTGLILMERWRRLGDLSGPTAERAADVTGMATASPASADKPKGLKSIVAGATGRHGTCPTVAQPGGAMGEELSCGRLAAPRPLREVRQPDRSRATTARRRTRQPGPPRRSPVVLQVLATGAG